MSELERAFITSADKTFKKVKAKDGRTMYFKDGTPITQNAFNAATQHRMWWGDGEYVNVAIPSNKGPGYERVKVHPKEASALGQELRLTRDDVPAQAKETVIIDGETYDTDTIAELNQRITDRHGPDVVFKYT